MQDKLRQKEQKKKKKNTTSRANINSSNVSALHITKKAGEKCNPSCAAKKEQGIITNCYFNISQQLWKSMSPESKHRTNQKLMNWLNSLI